MALKSEVEQLWLDLVQSGKITTLEDENKQLWSALVQSGNIRYNVMPIGAGVAVVSDGPLRPGLIQQRTSISPYKTLDCCLLTPAGWWAW